MNEHLPVSLEYSLSTYLLRMLDCMSCGAVLLDSEKNLGGMNGHAEACLGNGLMRRGPKLAASDRTADPKFQTLLDQALRDVASPGGARELALGLRRQGQRPLIARIVPVGPDDALVGRPMLLILLVDPENCPTPSSEALQQVFGLSRREAEVATKFMCGKTLQEIAEEGEVSIGTVRAQLKSIFAKTETSRQAELVALLTRVAIVAQGGK